MYVITYSLRDPKNGSDIFYQELAAFADDVAGQFNELANSAVSGYVEYCKGKSISRLRSPQEYSFELLVLGTLWNIYSGDASGLEKVPAQLLTGLTKLRKQGGSLKPGIDFIRGILSTLYLSPDLYDHIYTLDVSVDHLGILLGWLDATGEFSREVLRLRQWEQYLRTLKKEEAEDIIATAITLAAWFEDRSEEALGKYTENVDRYLNEIRPEHYWREDVIFCGRRRVEYHLNMVGAEIMNRAFRKRFLNTRKKTVLIPACMRILSESECKGHHDERGFHCAGCTADCSVFKLIRMGRENGFGVEVVSHESSISANHGGYSWVSGDTGIVGVACVLNLIAGGWLLDDMDIPAQCVFLNYCGCRNHWSREGIPTEINLSQLKKVLEID
ncbi:MAG TPA: DUF116 domain-containing protein [Clostridia bacterium]|nr:DUF116 domain-containing protein [Clostridia bacterium]